MRHRGSSRSEQAAELLRESGHEAKALDGGFPAREEEGLPVERSREAIGELPLAPNDLLDGRGEVVVDDAAGHPAEVGEGTLLALGLLGAASPALYAVLEPSFVLAIGPALLFGLPWIGTGLIESVGWILFGSAILRSGRKLRA